MLPDAWLGLGIVEDMEGNTQEGLTLILKASELDPNNPSIYHVLAERMKSWRNTTKPLNIMRCL